jgi:membrane protein implicated in regulation of membrane protease activity
VIGFSAAMGVLQGASFVVLALVSGLAGLAAGTVLFGSYRMPLLILAAVSVVAAVAVARLRPPSVATPAPRPRPSALA